LKLTAPAENFFRRGEILMEDALRTASLPADRGRVLLVRRLNVGKIRSNRSSATLALAIEHAIHALSAQAVYALEPAAYHQSAVYFRDDAEPYISLALKLARGESTNAWFWPLAVHAWRPTMPLDEALRSLLIAITRTEAGRCAATRMIQELHRRRVCDSLLSSLRREDGATLLQAFGWSRPTPLQPSFMNTASPVYKEEKRAFQIPAGWNRVLARWINCWGADDSRSIWLAAVALATEKAARLLDCSLLEQAQKLVSASGEQESRIIQSSELIDERECVRLSTNQLERAQAKISSQKIESYEIDEVAEINRDARSLVAPIQSSSRGQLVRSVENASENVEEKFFKQESSAELERLAPFDWPTRPQSTRHAGLFFLVPPISHLGFSKMLQSNPALIEIDLPQRLLRFIAERLSIPENDPALSFLSGSLPEQSPVNCEYSVPRNWTSGLCHKGLWTIRRLRDSGGGRILYDGSGRLALGLWRGPLPQSLRELMKGQTVKRGAVMPFEKDLTILCETWLVALRRWCRRYARIGLPALVCRPGRVLITPTHIDVLFDHQQADLRIRKVGLDINPGWVAWLGRVLTYHYLYGEQAYGK
jgi:hypothetical protein